MMPSVSINNRILVRGAGEMASAVIRRLHLAGFSVLALERPDPLCIRRKVCFAEAVYEQAISVEEVTGCLIDSIEPAEAVWNSNRVPIMIDPAARCAADFGAEILIDARMLKNNTDSSASLAPCVIGLGPGFTAVEDCWAVIETNRGFNLGRVIYQGSAEAYTGEPGRISGLSEERVLRSPCDGRFATKSEIGSDVRIGRILGHIAEQPLKAAINGVLRGLIRDASDVREGQKIGDIDPTGVREHCFLVSDKANAISGGVLEAVVSYVRRGSPPS